MAKKPSDLGLSREAWDVIIEAQEGHLLHRDIEGNRLLSLRDEFLPNIDDALSGGMRDPEAADLLAKLARFTEEEWEVVRAVVEGDGLIQSGKLLP